MQRTEYLTPKSGLKVLHPETLLPLPIEGCSVVMSPYWDRRIADGDVSVGKPKSKPAASSAA